MFQILMFDYIYFALISVQCFEINNVQYTSVITLYNLWFGQRLSIFSIDQLCIKWLCKPDILFDWLDIYGTWWHDIFCGTWSLKTWQAIHAIVFWLMIPILFWSFWHWWEHKKNNVLWKIFDWHLYPYTTSCFKTTKLWF